MQGYRSGHNEAVLKTVWGNPRGFESHTLRRDKVEIYVSALFFIAFKLIKISLPEYEVAAGYEQTGYFDGANYFTDEYIASKTNVTLVPKSSIIEYKIVFMNAENELTELAKTYTINDQVILPESYLVDGFNFDGWYDNKDFNGEPITLIESGNTGNKVFYAKLSEKTGFNIEYNFNGGNTLYKNKAEVVADLFKDISTYRGKETTPTTMGVYSGPWSINNLYKMLRTEPYKTKWTWLMEHFAETETNSYNKTAFKNGNNYTKSNKISCIKSNNKVFTVECYIDVFFNITNFIMIAHPF